MNVLEAIASRRAVKWYDAEHKMSDETFRTLMEHALLAPTAFNIQNWRFVRVTDPEQRRAIRATAWDQAQVTDASELLVLCFDTKAWNRDPQRYWRNAPQEVQDFLVPAIADYYRGKPQVERDEGIRVTTRARTAYDLARWLVVQGAPCVLQHPVGPHRVSPQLC